jgi:hypothetical protein
LIYKGGVRRLALAGFVITFAVPMAVRAELGLEVDPVPFFQHGYSVHLEYKPPLPKTRFTLGSYGLSVGDPGEASKNAGWTARERAVEVSGQWFPLSDGARGAFVALYVFGQRWRYAYVGASDEPVVVRIAPAGAVGFQWLPWSTGPYVVPWAALGVPLTVSGHAEAGGRTYQASPVVMVLAVHAGWEVNLP